MNAFECFKSFESKQVEKANQSGLKSVFSVSVIYPFSVTEAMHAVPLELVAVLRIQLLLQKPKINWRDISFRLFFSRITNLFAKLQSVCCLNVLKFLNDLKLYIFGFLK